MIRDPGVPGRRATPRQRGPAARGSGLRGGLAVQRGLELGLRLVGERGLQDGPAELLQAGDGLVGRRLLDDDEQRRGPRLDHVADLLLEALVDARLLDLPEQGAEAGADRHPEHRDEEQQAEQHAPEHAPGRARAHGMVVGGHLVLAIGVADDHRDRVGLDDQVLGHLVDRVGREGGGPLVVVADGDEVRHRTPPLDRMDGQRSRRPPGLASPERDEHRTSTPVVPAPRRARRYAPLPGRRWRRTVGVVPPRPHATVTATSTAHSARRTLLRAAPPLGHDARMIRRDRLLRRLLAAPGRVLLLTAPAGYGKSALLRSWERSDPRPFVWLSGPMDLLACARAPERLPTPCVVVADGLSTNAPEVRQAFSQLAEAMPRGSELAIASRGDGSLPLSRLRLDADVLELGARDLAMTHGEAIAALGAAGAELPAPEAERLLERLAGWPAALALAAQAGGIDDEHVLTQYVTDEALADVSPGVLAFLSACSVLEVLDLRLCDALTGREDAARMVGAAERAGVPLMRLDRAGTRWRCHPLVRDVLHTRLCTEDAAAARALNARATAWFDERGDAPRALHHALAAGDVDRVAGLLWRAAPEWTLSERVELIDDALTLIAPRTIERNAALDGTAALGELARGRGAHAVHHLELARDALADAEADRQATVAGGIDVLRALTGQDLAGLRAHAATAALTLTPGDPWRGLCSLMHGAGALLAGDEGTAQGALEDGARAGIVQSAGLAALCEAELALAALCADDWEHGACLAERARGRIDHLATERHGLLALVVAVSAFARAHRGRFEEARADVALTHRLIGDDEGTPPWHLAQVHLALARAQLRLSVVPPARTSLGAAARAADHLGDAPGLARWLAAARGCADAAASMALPSRDALTAAELRVLGHLPSHLSFREIGAQLFVSPNTIKTQAHAIYRKLGASSRSAAVARARQLGLLDRASSGSEDAVPAGAS